MIAARLAGGNLFLPFLVGIILVGDFGSTRSTRSTRIFLRGFWVGDFGSTRSTWIFLRGFVVGGFFFLGVVGCVLDCKCWKKLKND